MVLLSHAALRGSRLSEQARAPPSSQRYQADLVLFAPCGGSSDLDGLSDLDMA